MSEDKIDVSEYKELCSSKDYTHSAILYGPFVAEQKGTILRVWQPPNRLFGVALKNGEAI